MSSLPQIQGAPDLPLCIDLNFTLTLVDSTHESILRLCATAPFDIVSMPRWLGQGKSKFKREVAARGLIEFARLPFRADLIEWLTAERASGRRLVLVSSADQSIAQGVADHLNLFHEVIASNGIENLSGENKRIALVSRFGEQGFDYVGNGVKDESVWRSARHGIVVGGAAAAARTAQDCVVSRVFPAARPSLRTWAKAARLHQWVKNVLIFFPVALAHKFFDVRTVMAAVEAFCAFGLCASSVYMINDLLDLTSDRNHARKRNRPFASGALPATGGLVAAAVFLAAAVIIACSINVFFVAALGGYYALTWAYSLRLKRAAIVDVMTLAGLYTLRIIAGSAATSIEPSFWLLAFSMFMFISLGCVKRYTELNDAKPATVPVKAHGRGYWKSDLPLLLNLGTSSGYCTILVMALYLNSPDSQSLYRHAKPLWLMCPLMLYWISRVWLLTVRGQMHDDPVVFALGDRISMLVLAISGIIFWFSI
jgi:4-hydroxybenzoate polyprenyltransferase